MATATTSGEVKARGSKFTWVLKDFKKICLEAQNDQIWRSPDCHLDNSRKCYLKLAPKGDDDSCRDFISLYLNNSGSVFNAVVYLYILNSANQKMNLKTLGPHTYELRIGWGYPQFIKRSEIFSEVSLLRDGDLCVGCEIDIDSTIISGIDDIITLEYHPLVDEFDKFEELFENHNFSDVVLIVEGKKIPVHKSIITCGSPVFAAMFSHPMKENKENSVEIPDITYDVMQELLRFIYASRVQNLQSVADGLLIAAEKYSIKNLKMICENYLSTELTTENVMEYMSLADVHNASFLKSKCMSFINDNVKELVESPFSEKWDLSAKIMKEIFCSVVKSRVS